MPYQAEMAVLIRSRLRQSTKTSGPAAIIVPGDGVNDDGSVARLGASVKEPL